MKERGGERGEGGEYNNFTTRKDNMIGDERGMSVHCQVGACCAAAVSEI